MSFPSDVLLPANAKYHGFVDAKTGYNSHWDITWSFSFALTGSQHAFCTFLTTNPALSGGNPGQYLGYLGTTEYLLSESGEFILNEFGNKIVTNNSSSVDNSGAMAIAFDSTGYFALSNADIPGVSKALTRPNSLVIRDSNSDVIYNVPLSGLDSSFFLASSAKTYQTLRFRLAEAGKKLYIDHKTDTTSYKPLTSLVVSLNPNTHTILYPGLTFCSPISSSSITPSKLFLKNFHVQGNPNEPTWETITSIPLSASLKTSYTTITGITAISVNN